jgi:hypothetical protein
VGHPVDDHARWCGQGAVVTDRDVHGPVGVGFRDRSVRQRGWPAGEDGRPSTLRHGQRTGMDDIDAGVHRDQVPAAKKLADHGRRHAELEELSPCDDTVLERDQRLDVHDANLLGPARS